MTTLPVWWDDPADGPANMAADECLAEEALARGGPVVRLYGWTRTTVSLGAFQRIADAMAEPAIAGTPLVRRPSGGGAIVHGSDLTYAAAVPRDHPLGGRPQALYTAFHAALVEVLAGMGVAARMCAAGEPAARGGPGSFYCFDRRAEGDVVVALPDRPPAADDPTIEAKILGSAQRRLAGAVVQHGSLLVREAGGVGPAARHPGLADLHPAAAGVGPRDLAVRGKSPPCPFSTWPTGGKAEVFHGRRSSHPAPADSFQSLLGQLWLERVARGLGVPVAWQAGAFAQGREARISSLALTYGTSRWLERR